MLSTWSPATGSLYSIASLTSSAYLCILFTIIGGHPTWSTVSPPQPVSVTVDDFGPQAANATSSREHDSNLASAASPLLVWQLGTAFRRHTTSCTTVQAVITLARYCECCKGDDASQSENWKFDPLPCPNPLTDRHKRLHT